MVTYRFERNVQLGGGTPNQMGYDLEDNMVWHGRQVREAIEKARAMNLPRKRQYAKACQILRGLRQRAYKSFYEEINRLLESDLDFRLGPPVDELSHYDLSPPHTQEDENFRQRDTRKVGKMGVVRMRDRSSPIGIRDEDERIQGEVCTVGVYTPTAEGITLEEAIKQHKKYWTEDFPVEIYSMLQRGL